MTLSDTYSATGNIPLSNPPFPPFATSPSPPSLGGGKGGGKGGEEGGFILKIWLEVECPEMHTYTYSIILNFAHNLISVGFKSFCLNNYHIQMMGMFDSPFCFQRDYFGDIFKCLIIHIYIFLPYFKKTLNFFKLMNANGCLNIKHI